VGVGVAAVLLNRFVPPLFLKRELECPALANRQALLQLARQHHASAQTSRLAFSQLSQLGVPAFKLPHMPLEKPPRKALCHVASCLKKLEGLL